MTWAGPVGSVMHFSTYVQAVEIDFYNYFKLKGRKVFIWQMAQ